MKRKSILMFVILFSYLFSFIPFINAGYVYVSNIYQINESKDDVVYYVGFNYYEDDDFLMLKSNLYDVKTGFVFNNISILDNATFKEVYLSLYSNDSYTDSEDYWVTVYGIDEDNVSSFADFEDFNNKTFTSNNVNWNLEDLEGLDKWVNSSNVATIFNEIKARSGWDSGNNIGLIVLGTQSSNSYRMGMSYDGNSSYAPKLYVKYRYEVTEEEENCVFYKTYKGYDIYNCTTEGDCESSPYVGGSLNSTVDMTGFFATGLGNNRLCFYSIEAERHIVFYSNTTHIIYNTSTDGLTWDVGGNIIQFDSSLHLDTHYDEEEDYFDIVVHNGWEDGVPIYYRRGRLKSDGSITWLKAWQLLLQEAGTDYRLPRVCTDINDYPYITYMKEPASTLGYPYVLKSDNNDGTFSGSETPYCLKALDQQQWCTCLVRMDDGSDNEMYIFYGGSNTHDLYGRYYNGTGYEAEELVMDDECNVGSNYSPTNDGDDILLAYYRNNNQDLRYTWRDYSDEIGTKWQGETQIKVIGENNIYPVISLWQNRTIIIIWGEPVDDWIFYSKSDDYGVSFSAPYSWMDETTDDLKSFYISGYYRQYGEFVGVIYTTTLSSPYKLRYLALEGLEYEGDCGVIWYCVYKDGELVDCFITDDEAEEWIDEESQKYEAYKDLGNTISWMLGLLGLIMMPLGFVLFVSQAQSGDYRNAFLYLMICFFIGMSLFVGWLWG